MTETPSLAELQREIGRLRAQLKSRRYGLVWLDVPEGFETDSEQKLPIVHEVSDLVIPNTGNQRSHLLIEGDNFHTLTCLNYTHKGKIDVIYIDPPYNTGSDGFRYKDKRVLEQFPDGSLVPKDHPLRHSYWLSFMEKRLRLAKSLLKRNGAIFISINEDEFAQLKLLCDEIFSPSNYMTTFTIRVRHEERILKGDKDFHEVVEYLLMYRASSAYKTVKIERDNTSYAEYVYEVVETKPAKQTMTMGNKLVEVFPPGSFEINKVEADPKFLKKTSIRGTLRTGNSSGRFYVKHLEPLEEMKGYLFKVPDMGDDGTGSRYFLTPTKNKNGDYFQGTPLSKSDVKLIPHPNFMDWEFEFNTVGLEGGVQFGGGKKPIEFLKHYLQIGSSNKSAVVLDFFAGSGSTGHAVLDLNEEDGGNRQFILATLADEVVKDQVTHIAEDIARKRFENIRNDYKFGLKYYRNSFVGTHNVLDASDTDRLELAKHAGALLAISENTLHLEDATEYFQRYKDEVSERYTAIYFREELEQFEKFTGMVDALEGEVNVYVFTWGNEIDFVDEFTNKNARVKPIPQPILEVYRQIYAQGTSS